MRRGITLLILLFAVLVMVNKKISSVESKSSDIPQEAVRLRILANSNDPKDQEIKLKVRDEVVDTITPLVKDITDPEQARVTIYNHLDDLKDVVKTTLEENNVDMKFSVDYGYTEFPDKVYNNKLYPAGTYEAVYITLGEGEGDNWWCVLFPPLCLVDLATDSEGNFPDNTKVKYSFYIIDKFKKLFSSNS